MRPIETAPIVERRTITRLEHKAESVRVGLFQPRLESGYFRTDPSSHLINLREDYRPLRNKIDRVLRKASRLRVNILCFPELFMNPSILKDVECFANESRTIVIAGTYYRDRTSFCPIVVPKEWVPDCAQSAACQTCDTWISDCSCVTEKTAPSPFETVPIGDPSVGLKPGRNTVYINQSLFGTFAVLICSDFLRSEVRGAIARKPLDFLFVLACNPHSLPFHQRMNMRCEGSSSGIYGCYCNSVGSLGKFKPDGRSAIFGVMHDHYLDRLAALGLKPDDDIPYKVCEIEDDEMLVADFDLANKRVRLPKNELTLPNISIVEPDTKPITIYESAFFYEFAPMDLKRQFRVFLDEYPISISEMLWECVRERMTKTETDTLYPDEIIKSVSSEVKKRLATIFREMLKSKRNRDGAIRKVTRWEEACTEGYVPPSNCSPDTEPMRAMRERIVATCRGLAEKFVGVLPELNVVSRLVGDPENPDFMIVTRHEVDKRYIASKDLSLVWKGPEGTLKYFPKQPSSEAAIHWALHRKTRLAWVVHLNTQEICTLACRLLPGANLKELFPQSLSSISFGDNQIVFDDFRRSACESGENKEKLKVLIVEKAINVDVEELANEIADLWPTSADNNTETVVILGIKHAAWFAANDDVNSLELAAAINEKISQLLLWSEKVPGTVRED